MCQVARKALRDAVYAVKDQLSVAEKTKVLTKEEKVFVHLVSLLDFQTYLEPNKLFRPISDVD
jgi:hypothetical protein